MPGPPVRRLVLESVGAVVLLLAVLALVDVPERTLGWDTLFDVGHAPLFGLIAFQLRRLLVALRGSVPPARRSAETLLSVLALGIATEVAQLLQAGRSASAGDVLRDMAGVGAFLLLFHAWHRPGGETGPPVGRQRVLSTVLALALLAAVAAPLVTVGAIYAERRRALPVLYRLDGSWWERRLVEARNAELRPLAAANAPAGARAAAVLTFRPGRYPGVVFGEPYPDWRHFARLVLPVSSALDRPLPLVLRIHDAGHNQLYTDRFNRRIVVRPGDQQIVIPLDEVRRAPRGREMDMGRIRAIILFGVRLDRAVEIRLGPLRLE